jgi:hypothetical protein
MVVHGRRMNQVHAETGQGGARSLMQPYVQTHHNRETPPSSIYTNTILGFVHPTTAAGWCWHTAICRCLPYRPTVLWEMFVRGGCYLSTKREKKDESLSPSPCNPRSELRTRTCEVTNTRTCPEEPHTPSPSVGCCPLLLPPPPVHVTNNSYLPLPRSRH